MQIVITGHKGYLGSALFAELSRRGFRPVGFDLVNGPGEDITDPAVRDKIAELAPDILFNLAGVSGEQACRADLERSRKVNRDAPVELMAACPARTVFVQASSASVLGRKVDSPYAQQKYQAESRLFLWKAANPLYVLRFGTVLGYNFDGPTRWETPANSMARSAVRERKIVVNGPELMRPWVTLQHLVRYLTSFATHLPKVGWDGPIPVAQENMSLGDMARLVGLYREGCEKVFNPSGEDARDYTMPCLLGTVGGGVNWAMRELVGHA